MSGVTNQWKSGRILHLDLLTDSANKALAADLLVERTPTFVLFDAHGNEVKRWVDVVPKLEELP